MVGVLCLRCWKNVQTFPFPISEDRRKLNPLGFLPFTLYGHSLPDNKYVHLTCDVRMYNL